MRLVLLQNVLAHSKDEMAVDLFKAVDRSMGPLKARSSQFCQTSI